LSPGDLRIEQRSDGGYHLFIRAKGGLGSVLLTESTKDPEQKADNFALRALEANSINGNETRLLDGKSLSSAGELHFLVDSSPEADSAFGRAFHVFIPWVVAWGYPWSRSGKVFIHDGTFINIRAFAKPFADYEGGFMDNPYLIRVSQAALRPAPSSPKAPPPVSSPTPAAPPSSPAVPTVPAASKPPAAPAAKAPARVPAAPTVPAAPPPARSAPVAASYEAALYLPETLAEYRALAAANRGEIRYASSDEDIASQIEALLARERGKSVDLVLCLDTTDTMINGLAALKARLPAVLARRAAEFPSFRIGLVAFKDYFEEYLYKRLDFTSDLRLFAEELDSLQCGGGRDIPEAVYEALYATGSEFPWAAQARLAILVGDAPPHPLPRGSVDAPAVAEAASAALVEIDAVAVPK
jgi:Mg-chelatase subunit ChlD